VAAEAEGGTTWFALTAIAEELTAGNACLYLDFEDDEGGIAGRLMTMGCDRGVIRKRRRRVRPDAPPLDSHARARSRRGKVLLVSYPCF
jgi:hypothetical protein